MTSWRSAQVDEPNWGLAPGMYFERIAREAHSLGFEFCCHGVRIPVPITRPRTLFFSNYRPEWKRRYQERHYIDIDPTVAHGMRSSEPVLWSDTFFADVPELWQEAKSFGLCHGWAQSRRDPEGAYSMLVLARSHGPIEAAELRDKERQMQWLVHVAHQAIKDALADTGLGVRPPALSAREVEILRWTAEGKTAADIAEFLSISERTVNFHVNCVVEKMGACNKTSAAVRAAMLGLIW